MAEIASALVKVAAIIGGAIVAIFGIMGLCAMIIASEDRKTYLANREKTEEEFLKRRQKTEENIKRIGDEIQRR